MARSSVARACAASWGFGQRPPSRRRVCRGRLGLPSSASQVVRASSRSLRRLVPGFWPSVEWLLPRAGPISNLRERNETERSEEHTSELQSLMRISYAVFCLKKKKTKQQIYHIIKNKNL